jgi:hypothetical protein
MSGFTPADVVEFRNIVREMLPTYLKTPARKMTESDQRILCHVFGPEGVERLLQVAMIRHQPPWSWSERRRILATISWLAHHGG